MRLNDRLESLSKRFDEIEAGLAQTGGSFDQERYTAIVKERAAIEETVEVYRRFRRVRHELAESERVLATERDPEMRAMLDEEAQSLREQVRISSNTSKFDAS